MANTFYLPVTKNISSLWKSKREDGISETGYENAKVVYDKVGCVRYNNKQDAFKLFFNYDGGYSTLKLVKGR